MQRVLNLFAILACLCLALPAQAQNGPMLTGGPKGLVKNSKGEQLYPGGVPLGSEAYWPLWLTGEGALIPAFEGQPEPN